MDCVCRDSDILYLAALHPLCSVRPIEDEQDPSLIFTIQAQEVEQSAASLCDAGKECHSIHRLRANNTTGH